jgi:hypothetical protein
MRCTAPTRWADASDRQGGRHGTAAPDGVALEPVGVCELGLCAVGLGAFGSERDVHDDGAVTVFEAGPALATLNGHVPFLALRGDDSAVPRGRRSGPTKFVEALVVDSEVVGDLVDDGDSHFLGDLGL